MQGISAGSKAAGPIAENIKRVVIVAKDARDTIQSWRRILRNTGVRHTRDLKYRFLLAIDPPRAADKVSGRNGAERPLEKEMERWRRDLQMLARLSGAAMDKPPRVWPPGRTEAAFGFWMFPVNVDDEAPLGLSDDVPIKLHPILGPLGLKS
ncbi:hypothetical protein TruAng_002627 [Truncatella angustata]|nr:hypothetical protein TruAng_002627 [Truncatella angustata]